MAPFGETVLAWRVTRGLTQAELARRARVPRPNLSAIERGDREVTVRTLRSLALALDIRPGILVDGIMPGANAPPLTRAALERIASAAVSGARLPDAREAKISHWLSLAASAGSKRSRADRRTIYLPGVRERERAHLLLKGSLEPGVLATLLDRLVRMRE
jgi:transcriptional regulator with XRE-family HTH domain